MVAVIVGASVGGARTVQALRRFDYPDRVVLVGDEPHAPYDRPPLSKGLLAGQLDHARIALLRPADLADPNVELRLGTRAERVDAERHELHLACGDVLAWDHLVLATGASARPAPWADLPVLRTLDDAQRLSACLARGSRLIVIGGGFIGSEVASTAHDLGLSVTVVDPLEAPIARIVGAELGARLARLHTDNGVCAVLGTGVTAVEPDGGGWVVHLADGSIHPADVVVAGIGARPNDEWIAASGLPVADGVLCDEYSRVAGYSDVYAVGDVARWLHPRHGEVQRIEHWTNAVEQAESVARTVCGVADPQAYAPTEYVWTEQYAHKVQIIGRPAAGDAVFVTTGDWPRTGVLYVGADDALVGAATVDWPRGMLAARRVLAEAGSLAAAQDSWAELLKAAPAA